MKKQLIILALLFGLLTTLEAQTMIIPKREVRAVWLTTLKNLDWPRTPGRDSYSIARQKQELRNILDKYQKANINTVLLQAVDRASAIYPSAIYPWDACVSGRFGVNPGYDPLAFAIAECHKRGMEVQAWIATLPVGPYTGSAAKRLRARGYKMFKLDGDAFLDPSQESTAELITSVAREITTHYDIDGIHLDYIRYPEMLPAPRNAYVAQWRRDKITDIVRKVHDAVKAEKPWVRISCSPIGKYSDLSRYSSNNWNARDRVSQDAQLWLRLGLMDQLYPMIYFRGNNFYPFAADWAENSCGKVVVAGLGTYFLDRQNGGNNTWSLDDIAREMMVSRRMGLGTAHFRSRYFTENVKGIYDFSSLVYAPFPALVPAIKEDGGNGPKKPASLSVSSGELVIGRSGPRQLYNVYGSDRWPVDITDARNLLFILSYADTEEQADYLLEALRQLAKDHRREHAADKATQMALPAVPAQGMTPREAFFAPKGSVAFSEAEGHIAAEQVMFYPPGIPILCPGDVIDAASLRYIEAMQALGLKVVGPRDASLGRIQVVK